MKPLLRKSLILLLCLSFCLCLIPAAYAEGGNAEKLMTAAKASGLRSVGAGPCPVRFYSEKGYDLAGLLVSDASGKALEPAATDGGWTYLLAPGTYTYRYHDDRAIFADIGETAFTVDGALEIALDLKAAFEDNFTFSWELNPLYDDFADGDDLEDYTFEDALDEMIEYKIAESENSGRRRMLRGALSPAEQVRNAMVARQKDTPITFYSTEAWDESVVNATYNQVLKEAVRHTGDHREGDTLSFEYYQFGKTAEWSPEPDETGTYTNTIIFKFLYRTTAEQEQAVCDLVDNLAAGLSEMSDYQKAFAIDQWIYQNVDYDYAHLSDKSYQRQYTAYAALFDRTAVCQGYSLSFYRLALAAGLDARIVSSLAMNHAWNIMEIDGAWYALDTTWDANRRKGGEPLEQLPYYFLRGTAWWLDNHRVNGISVTGDQFDPENQRYYDPDFDTYTLSEEDYSSQEPGTYIVSYNANGGDSAPENQVKLQGTDLTLTEELPARAPLPEETLTLTLDGNGGTIATTTNPEAAKASIRGKKKVSYSFIEWNTKRDKSGTGYHPGDVYQNDASVELFAQWKATAVYSMFTLPTPSREGYFFAGWGTSSDATEGVTGKYILKGNVTLYAVWVQPDFVLPASLTDIEEEAFAGGAFTFVKLPDTIRTVGPRAFADCPNLKYIYIPAEAEVDPTAFENVEGLTVFRPAE